MKYPNYIPQSQINWQVEKLLFDFNGKPLEEQPLPIPVEDILELHLGYALYFDDLGDRFGYQDTFGMINFEHKSIWIDSSLDPGVSSTPNEGRYLFTLSHEIGHDQLHLPFYQNRHIQLDLLKPPETAIMCRDSSKKEPQEIQADLFASELLMPEVLVRRHFQGIWDAIQPDTPGWSAEMMMIDALCQRFKASKQAMGIRLETLKLWHGRQSNRLVLTP